MFYGTEGWGFESLQAYLTYMFVGKGVVGFSVPVKHQ